MKEKTRILVSITAIFVLAVVVVAFGSFIENQKELDVVSTAAGKSIKINEKEPEKIELEEAKKQVRFGAIKLKEKSYSE